MEGLAKLAASFDARRNKQYWQILKRLHGGSDEAVQAISSSGNRSPHIAVRKKQFGGLRSRHVDKYKPTQILEHKPEPGIFDTALARPSQLAGTKNLYPNPQNIVKHDMNNALSPNELVKDQLLTTEVFKRFPDEMSIGRTSVYRKPTKKTREKLSELQDRITPEHQETLQRIDSSFNGVNTPRTNKDVAAYAYYGKNNFINSDAAGFRNNQLFHWQEPIALVTGQPINKSLLRE